MSKTPTKVFELHWFKGDELQYIERPRSKLYFTTMSKITEILNTRADYLAKFEEYKATQFPSWCYKVKSHIVEGEWQYKYNTHEELSDLENNRWFNFNGKCLLTPRVFKHTLGIIDTEEIPSAS